MISVIIPVYKTEEYLDECIQSVVNQTYQELEIILVDDGSPDNCPKMCDEWAKKDSRIRAIHKQNGGAADARNVGLDEAKGEYIFFLDSDDYILANIFEILLDKIETTKSDMVIFDFKSNEKIDGCLKAGEYLKQEVLDMFKYNSVMLISASNRLYKKELFCSIRFQVGKICEDEFAAHNIIAICEKITVISDQLYFYRQNPQSVMNTRSYYKSSDSLFAYYNRIIVLKKYKLNDAIETQLSNFYKEIKYLYPKLIIGDETSKARGKEILEMYIDLYDDIKSCKKANCGENQILKRLLRYFPCGYAFMFNLAFKRN